jgi:hypothetical protein
MAIWTATRGGATNPPDAGGVLATGVSGVYHLRVPRH